jgi:mercuric ion transport protein
MSATRVEASEATPDGPTSAALRRNGDRTQRLIAAGGVLGALGAASCCVIPFALFLAGVSGAWIGNLTALEPYQPIFAIVSLSFVGYGAWRLNFKPTQVCADGFCTTPQSDRVAKIGFWIAGTLVAIALGFPYAAGYFV